MYTASVIRLTPADASDTGSGSANAASNSQDMFMQLLVTQLKNQSPIDPVDPNQFVSQLVQFNTLNQIVGIRQLLDQLSSQPSTDTGSKK
jgi:flagellar basal-body rod modification protein FlgD